MLRKGGAIVMAISLVLCTVGARFVLLSSGEDRAAWGAVVATFTFVYTSTFGASWVRPSYLFGVRVWS